MKMLKLQIKILAYIGRKRNVQYKSLSKKFRKAPDLEDTLGYLSMHKYINQSGGYRNSPMEMPNPLKPGTTFSLEERGREIVESHQWFTTEYVVTHMLIPIILSVISTLITLFLTHAL